MPTRTTRSRTAGAPRPAGRTRVVKGAELRALLGMDAIDGVPLRVVFSARRKSSATFVVRGEVAEAQVPAAVSPAQLREFAPDRFRSVIATYRRAVRVGPVGDAWLAARAADLTASFFAGLTPAAAVRWDEQMRKVWGTCQIASREITLAAELREMPDWVIDGVLIHELAHLLEPDHGQAFKVLVAHYPAHERVEGFLDGWLAARGTTRDLS